MDQSIFKRGVIEIIKNKILCDFEYEYILVMSVHNNLFIEATGRGGLLLINRAAVGFSSCIVFFKLKWPDTKNEGQSRNI